MVFDDLSSTNHGMYLRDGLAADWKACSPINSAIWKIV